MAVRSFFFSALRGIEWAATRIEAAQVLILRHKSGHFYVFKLPLDPSMSLENLPTGSGTYPQIPKPSPYNAHQDQKEYQRRKWS